MSKQLKGTSISLGEHIVHHGKVMDSRPRWYTITQGISGICIVFDPEGLQNLSIQDASNEQLEHAVPSSSVIKGGFINSQFQAEQTLAEQDKPSIVELFARYSAAWDSKTTSEWQISALKQQVLPTPPSSQEYVDPYLFETGHFESREEYEELTRTAKIKPRSRA